MNGYRTFVNGRWPLMLPAHRADFHREHRTWEIERITSMHDLLEPGSLIVDVGAEEGDMPALWALFGCRVAMIECKAEAWRNIRACWELNDLPPPAGIFVGFASDVTDLQPLRPYDLASGYALEADGWPLSSHGALIPDPGFAVLAQQADSIPQTTLDDFARHEGLIVNAITIDVEGAEHRVLIGADRILSEDRPLVWVSIHSDRAWVEDLYDCADEAVIVAWMDARGYDATELARDHEAHFLFSPRG